MDNNDIKKTKIDEKKNSDEQKTAIDGISQESGILAGYTNILNQDINKSLEKHEQETHKQNIVSSENKPLEDISENDISSRYKIVGKIGSGGMGKVYQAIENKSQKTVAIKVMSNDITLQSSKRFLREAKAMSRLQHPNIIRLYDVSQSKKKIFLSMELLAGGSLRQLLQKRKRLPEKQVVRIMRKILQAMAYAHKKGIIHRDLKPENIMFRENGEPVVMDFGLAKFMVSDTQLTKTGSMMGTLGYMSPEQVNGIVKEIDERTDIYSLGAIMYELLSGRLPLVADTQASLILKIFNEVPPRLSDLNISVPEGLETICLKALAKSKQNRYETVMEMLQDIEQYRNGQVVFGEEEEAVAIEKNSTHKQNIPVEKIKENKQSGTREVRHPIIVEKIKENKQSGTRESRRPIVVEKTQEVKQSVTHEIKHPVMEKVAEIRQIMPLEKTVIVVEKKQENHQEQWNEEIQEGEIMANKKHPNKESTSPLILANKIVNKNMLYSVFDTFCTFFSNLFQKKNRDIVQKKMSIFWKTQKKNVQNYLKKRKKR